jgi:hypothetical protein
MSMRLSFDTLRFAFGVFLLWTLCQAVAFGAAALAGRDAIAPLMAALREKPSIIGLRDIASLRENGRAAGPELVGFLSSSDPDVRVGAARAVGFIGYAEAVDSLVPLLSDRDDWRLVYVAAESLGRLGARQAIPALDTVAAQHWYPPVVKTAQLAVRVINGQDTYRAAQGNFAYEFFSFERVSDDRISSAQSTLQPSLLPERDRLTGEERQTLTYDIDTVSYGQNGRQVVHSKATPTCGLKVAGGYIVGADRGEWGGELVYSSGPSRARILKEENTMAIHRLPVGVVAVTGLGHLSLNRGALYLVKPVEGGGYQARLWKTLPGAPGRSGVLSNGSLYVQSAGGAIVVTPDGQMAMATEANVK